MEIKQRTKQDELSRRHAVSRVTARPRNLGKVHLFEASILSSNDLTALRYL